METMNLAELDVFALPCLLLESRRDFPQQPAIYFAIDPQDNIQYIGRSANPRARWSSHHQHGKLEKIGGVRIAYLLVERVEMLPEIESALIAWFNPPLNGRAGNKDDEDKILRTPRLAFAADPETRNYLERWADEESRSLSQLVGVIVKEAIKRREERNKKGGK